jgi:subtilisin-like proprotein convertase family protein
MTTLQTTNSHQGSWVGLLLPWIRKRRTALPGRLATALFRIILCCACVGRLQATVVATDNFNRTDGPLGPDWSNPLASQGNLVVTNGLAGVDTENAHCEAFWTADSFSDDQYSQIALSSIGPWTGVILRADSDFDPVFTDSGSQFYIGFVFGPNDYRIYHWINGAYYPEAVGTTETWQTNDILRLEISGSIVPLITMYRNGKPVLLWLVADAPDVKTGGSPGIGIYSRTGAGLTVDNWEGGNLESDTNGPTIPDHLTTVAAGPTQINLSWTPSSDDVGVVGYLVERSQGEGSTNFFLLSTPAGTNYSDTGATTRYTMYTTNSARLLPGTTYNYRVRATDAAGNLSGYTAVATTTTVSVAPPTILPIPDETTLTGVAVGPFPFTVSDPPLDPATFTATATSSNPALVPDENVFIFHSGSIFSLTAVPIDGQSGSTIITVIVSNGVDSTNASFLLTVNPPGNGTDVFANSSNIVIPSIGTATPYPSTINVSGEVGTITNVMVTLHGMSHTYPGDVNMVLVGPGGQAVVLMSDAVGSSWMDDVTFTLSDKAFYPLPVSSAVLHGTFKPTDYAPNHSDPAYAFPPPAPAPPYTTNLSTFNGISPNGTWSLYVYDGGPGDSGQISGGWSLAISTISALGISGLTGVQSTPVNTATGAIPFQIRDAQTPASNLLLSATSSDPTVINAASGIDFGGSDTNRTITLTPEPNKIGSSTISVIVTDGGGLSATNSFLLTVDRGQLTVTGLTADNKTYDGTTGASLNTNGYALAGEGLVATPSLDVSLDASGSSAAFSDPNAGSGKTVNVSGLTLTGANAGNYTLTQPTLTADIAKANPNIVVTPYSVTYDGAAHTATGTAKGVLNEDLSGLDLAGTTHATAGTYVTDPWYFTDSTGNYNNANGTVDDAIATAPLTVTPDDASRAYGQSDPAFSVSYNGFVNSENSSVLSGTLDVSSVADTNSPIGAYPITASGLTSGNYLITYQHGTLTVSNALLTLTANNTNKIYGQTITFAGTEFSAAGLVSTDSVSSVTLSSAGAAAMAGVAGSPYNIDITNAVGDDGLTNYLITYVPGTITVDPVPTAITLISSLNPALLGVNVTFTVSTAPVHPATGTPNGAVQFYANGITLGDPVPLSAGAASLSTTLLPQGSSTITAVYLPDDNFLDSTNFLVQAVRVETPLTQGIAGALDGSVTATFHGTPGGQYLVQVTDDLKSIPWSTIATNIAGTNGLWSFTESTTNHAQRFFRAASP